ncbi:hypothetical protein RDWZM_002739 [Blomia tropicalis]|uniref:RNA helicase n=1 Tax=Blomia tropicalis TaxID=40697 RepID=A0A9Q0MEQ3_BLOTA|nr:hypothetical protein RDWZM_002739 [Blomia tropicalis]
MSGWRFLRACNFLLRRNAYNIVHHTRPTYLFTELNKFTPTFAQSIDRKWIGTVSMHDKITIEDESEDVDLKGKDDIVDGSVEWMSTKFHPKLMHSLEQRINFKEPTPVQAKSIPILMEGRDLISVAVTGSGKTIAFLLPALQRFLSQIEEKENERRSFGSNPKVLILAPTRELALQIFDVIKQFRMPFKSICLYGGSDRKKQVYFLENNSPLIVVSTPGRLKDLIDADYLSLKNIEYLVVDEADRMLDMGFEPQISYLIRKCPLERQTMMFSATWPEEVQSLARKYLRPDHAFLSLGGTKLVANPNIIQNVFVCQFSERLDKLGEILRRHHDERIIIFANTKMACQKISNLIYGKYKIYSAPIHGDLTQNQRERTLQARDLIKILNESGNSVPNELRQIAESRRSNKNEYFGRRPNYRSQRGNYQQYDQRRPRKYDNNFFQ